MTMISTGVSPMQAFFVKIDSPLNIDHRILEVWDGEMTTYVRGEAEMAKKAEPDTKVTAPFMWTHPAAVSAADSSRLDRSKPTVFCNSGPRWTSDAHDRPLCGEAP
jgi:hypothetical protein